MWQILAMTAGEISGIITGVVAGIVAIIGAIGKVINEQRRKSSNTHDHVCVFTGKQLKPRPKGHGANGRKPRAKSNYSKSTKVVYTVDSEEVNERGDE